MKMLTRRIILQLCTLIAALGFTPAFAEQKPGFVVDGANGIAKKNLEASINLERYRCANTDWQLKRLEEQIKRDASTALQAVGYYSSSIQTRINRASDCWNIVLETELGPRTKLEQVTVEINGELKDTKAMGALLARLPLQQDAFLNHADYTASKSEIAILAARFGFFSGEFLEHELLIDAASNSASARLIYQSGPAARFGKIEVTQSYLDEEFFSEYLIISPGDKYDSHALIKQQQILLSSGYFSTVNVAADQSRLENNSLPLKIELSNSKRFSYRFGVGVSTDTGPRLSLDYTDRRLNRAGHGLKLNSSISTVRSEITGNYSIPNGNAGTNRMDFQLGYLFEDTDTTKQSSLKAAANDVRVIGNDWIRTRFVEYLYEEFTTAATSETSQFLMPGISFKKSKVDNPILPLRGWRFNTKLRLASEDLLSSTSLAQVSVAAKVIKPFAGGRLIGRLDVGLSEVDDFSQLPVSLRYYAGGDASVRGFDYKSLGPTNSLGEITGGKNLLAASIEFDHRITTNWGLAAFVDSGNAFNNFSDYQLSTGAGIGVRWYSPIGPIRLDLAQDIEGNQSPRLHLSMGLDL